MRKVIILSGMVLGTIGLTSVLANAVTPGSSHFSEAIIYDGGGNKH